QPTPEGPVARGLTTDAGRSKPKPDLAKARLDTWTVEASFLLARLGQSHGLVGKDGRPKPGASGPLQLRIRGDDDRVQIEAYDSKNVVHEVRSKEPVVARRWYHVAASDD